MLNKNYIIVFGLIIIIVIILLFSISIYTLELRSFSDDGLIFRQKIQPGDKFTLKYIHSVALTPVWNIFTINDKYQIILIETDFFDHGAGLPYTAFDQEVLLKENGKFKLKNIHKIMSTPFYYWTIATCGNCFYFKGQEINLSSLLGDKLITIELNKYNLFDYFFRRNF